MTARGATTAAPDLLTLGLAAALNHQLPPAKALAGAVTTFDAFSAANPTTGQLWPRSGQSG